MKRLRRAPVSTIARRLRRLGREIADLPHEMRLGIRTATILPQFIDKNEQNLECDPVPYRTLGAVAHHMAVHAISPSRFADLGCGLGRPLYFFADRFDELRGYELVAPIQEIASTRLARARARRPEFSKISIECADATTALLLDQPLVAFLYNPFGPKPMARLCHRLRQARCDVHIYYVHPRFAEIIAHELAPPSDIFHCDFDVAYFHVRGADSAA